MGARVKEWLAPRKGWRRGIEYLGRRMQRLPDTPTSIALGFACGVYTSFTPFFGFHFVVAAAIAWLLRVNVFASAIGTFFGNPLTFPFIVATCLEMGFWILGHDETVDAGITDLGFYDLVSHLLANVGDLVVPYFVGGLLPGLACAVMSYFLIKPLVKTYQARRRARLLKRAKSRLAQPATPIADPAE